ncbi:MAG: SCO family protein [Chloroflexota bacterium]
MNRSWIWLPLLFVPIITIMVFAIYKPILVLPRIALAPGFSLLTQEGSRLTSEDLRGQLTLYNFTYSGCQPPCPQTGQTMKAIQNQLPQLDPLGPEMGLLSISVDPAQDTPERLQMLSRALGADESRWRFATGSTETVKQVIGGGFRTYYHQSATGEITLEPAFILVDGWGIQRAEYRTEEPDITIILRDIKLLQKEAKNSKGAMRYAYEAAHLFLCYP